MDTSPIGQLGCLLPSASHGTGDLTIRLCLMEILSILKDILSFFMVATETSHIETEQCCFWEIRMSF